MKDADLVTFYTEFLKAIKTDSWEVFGPYFECDLEEDFIFKKSDNSDYPLEIYVTCSDLFFWGCADAEQITLEDIDLLKKSICDGAQGVMIHDRDSTVSFVEHSSSDWGLLLFCCRKRKMRPQKPYLDKIPKHFLPIFLECGPERDE